MKKIQPEELGLGIDSWRENQWENIDKLNELFKSYDAVLFEAPTGSGKTVVSTALAKLNDWKTYHLTSTIQLQEQILDSFDFVSTIKGRSNYQCNLFKSLDCSKCFYSALKRECPMKADCEYIKAREKALNEQITVHNYTYFLYAFNYTDLWPRADFMVFDEAHRTENELMNFISYKFTYDDFHDTMELAFPGEEDVDLVMERLEDGLEVVEDKIQQTKGQFQETLDGDMKAAAGDLHVLKHFESLKKRIEMVMENFDSDFWVMTYYRPDTRYKENDWSDSYIEFKPVLVGCYMRNMVNAEKCLFMSATIGEKDTYCSSLGLDKDKVAYVKVPSTFDVRKRPCIYNPVGNMSKSSYDDNFDDLIDWIDAFIGYHKDVKGVIHTVSYQIASDIKISSCWSDMFIDHMDSGRELALEDYVEAEPPAILLSPSMDTGVDFRYDDARWQLIVKYPYPYLGDKQVKTRMEMDQNWYRQKATNRFVQTYGRGMRAPDDYCETWVLDASFSRALKNTEMFPDWFLDAVAQIDDEKEFWKEHYYDRNPDQKVEV